MASKPNTQLVEAPKTLSPEEISAKIALTGNLADLSPAEQMGYYERYCSHLGLDPITRPFDLLTQYEMDPDTQRRTEKTTLYANASCSAQLANSRQVTYGKPETEYNEKLGLLIIRVQAIMTVAPGMIRSCWRSGVAHIDGFKGRKLENAIKKAETQAHRRATLALCGVAMPDESELEDIQGAHVSPLQVDSAIGGAYELIGELLRARNLEDSSGARRFVLDGLVSGSFQGVAQYLGIPLHQVEDMARKAGMTRKLGQEAYTIPRQGPSAIQEAHAHVSANLDAKKTGNTKIAEDIQAANPERFPKVESPAVEEPEQKPEPAKTLDPTPALAPTLTSAQQKVSDLVMAAWKDHAKDKAVTLHLIGEFLGRKVKRSADLSDEEAGRVAGYLEGCMAQWADEAKAEPIKYTSTVRAHGVVVGGEMDALVQKLTMLGMSGSQISQLISEFTFALSGRTIANRFELNDDEGKAVIEALHTRIDEIECQKAIAADEV